jgi:hypothetical protein
MGIVRRNLRQIHYLINLVYGHNSSAINIELPEQIIDVRECRAFLYYRSNSSDD